MIHGIGIDIVQLARIQRAIETYGERFLQRIYCPAEIEACEARGEKRILCCAERFAAKEAAFKTVRNDSGDALSWHDFEVRTDADGAVTLGLSERATEVCAQLGIRTIHLSLSHTRTSASAIVVAEK